MDIPSLSWPHGLHAQALLSLQNVSHTEWMADGLMWISPGSWTVPVLTFTVLGTWIPACVGLLTVLYDLLSGVHYPRFVQGVFRTLTAPFRNFLTLHDLEDIGDPIPQPVWKCRILALLSLVQSFAWLSVLLYAQVVNTPNLAIQSLVGFLTWVCCIQ